MADEQRETEDPGTDEMLAEEQPEDAQLSTQADEHRALRRAGRRLRGGAPVSTRSPLPSSAT